MPCALAVSLLAVWFPPALAAGAAPPVIPPSERIIWKDRAKHVAAFVPEDLLQRGDLARLPLDTPSRRTLSYQLTHYAATAAEYRGLAGTDLPICLAAVPYRFDVASPSLVERLGEGDLYAIAYVRALVPGWSLRESRVAVAVYLEIERVLYLGAGPVRVGDTLVHLLPGGRLQIGGVPLCVTEPPIADSLHLRQEVLLVGERQERNPWLLSAARLFPLVDGAVVFGEDETESAESAPLDAVLAAIPGALGER
jgi:hypothetical protein